ncbi:MAG: ATP-dependent Clp protease ATP-binding subunit ClpX [candidate division WOR-3 bacterium]
MQRKRARTKERVSEPYCSFCGKPQSATRRLLPGVDAFICPDCARLAVELLSSPLDPDEPLELPVPERIKSALDEWVIGQERAKKTLSVAVYNHYKRINHRRMGKSDVELEKSNILLVGPTGTGKTLLARTLARLIGVPIVIFDATPITEAGYVGEDAEAILTRLIAEANGDMEKARIGIVYLDEADKLARKPGSGRDVSGEGAQQALLKITEGSAVDVPLPGRREKVSLDTRDILFIFAGSFEGLSDIVAERLGRGGIGFGRGQEGMPREELYRLAQPEDLISFGMIPELVGRLPVIVTLSPLTEDELAEIMTKPRNAIVKQFKRIFGMEDVALEITDEAIREIARAAAKRGSGARGLRSIMEDILLDTMYKLPSMKDVTKVIVNGEVARGEREPILVFSDQRRGIL